MGGRGGTDHRPDNQGFAGAENGSAEGRAVCGAEGSAVGAVAGLWGGGGPAGL